MKRPIQEEYRYRYPLAELYTGIDLDRLSVYYFSKAQTQKTKKKE
jgi:hypothetical protein